VAQLIKLASCTGEPRASVIFVHGISGHCYDTWRKNKHLEVDADATFWPRWLAEDVDGLVIYTLAYEAPVSNWLGTAMPLQDRAVNIRESLLDRLGAEEHPINFVCHSLGGLMIKQIVLDLKEQEERRPEARKLLDRTQQVVFIATPHTGSRSATILQHLSFLTWPTSTARSLVANDPGLRKLNVSYRGLADDRRNRLSHRVYFETLSSTFGTIVDEASSDPGLHSDPVPIHGDHITIAKPEGKESDLYIGVRNFIASFPLSASPQTYVIVKPVPKLPAQRRGNLVPLLIRVALLVIVGAGVARLGMDLFQSAPVQSSIDELTFASILVAVSDDNERIRIAEIRYHRKLDPGERQMVAGMRSQFVAAPTLTAGEQKTIAGATTPAALESVLSGLDSRPCNGSPQFVIKNERLTCQTGAPILMMAAAGSGGPLVSREAIVFHSSGTDGRIDNVLRWFVREIKNASVHLLVARSGAVVQLVPFDKQAFHAGASEWKERNLHNLNRYSIGVMLLDSGKGDYTPEQLETVRGIVRAFKAVQPAIGIVGHSEISLTGKTDPGPTFPIEEIRGL
jgi:hypothetical protein